MADDAQVLDITITTDAGQMPAHLWLPPSGSGPGIVLLQEIFGVSAYIRRRASDLASLGYVVLAPEIFWRIGATEPLEGDDALDRAMGLVQQLDWDAATADGVAAVHALREHEAVTRGVGLLGFCFGGGLGYQVAAALEGSGAGDNSDDGGDDTGEGTRRDSPADALVSYYGSSLPQVYDKLTVTAPSLHHFGLADSYIDQPTVRAIEAELTQQPETTLVTYEGAEHAFDNSDMGWFDPQASSLAWERTVEFLAERLPVG